MSAALVFAHLLFSALLDGMKSFNGEIMQTQDVCSDEEMRVARTTVLPKYAWEAQQTPGCAFFLLSFCLFFFVLSWARMCSRIAISFEASIDTKQACCLSKPAIEKCSLKSTHHGTKVFEVAVATKKVQRKKKTRESSPKRKYLMGFASKHAFSKAENTTHPMDRLVVGASRNSRNLASTSASVSKTKGEVDLTNIALLARLRSCSIWSICAWWSICA